MKHPILNGLLGAVLLFAASAQAAVLDVADLVEKNGPAVVNISTTKIVQRSQGGFPMPDEDEMFDFFRKFFPPRDEPPQRSDARNSRSRRRFRLHRQR